MTECPSAIAFGALASEFHAQVGGKCASLGVMSQAGLPVPPGFAVTTRVFTDARAAADTMSQIKDLLADLDSSDNVALARAASRTRDLIRSWELPEEHEERRPRQPPLDRPRAVLADRLDHRRGEGEAPVDAGEEDPLPFERRHIARPAEHPEHAARIERIDPRLPALGNQRRGSDAESGEDRGQSPVAARGRLRLA